MSIRKLFKVGLVAVATLGLAAPVQSQNTARYPSGPVKLLVPYTPSGLVDTSARHVGQAASQAFGQPVVIENRPGAGGRLAASVVASAPPDGRTLLFTTLATMTMNPFIPPKPPFDVEKDFEPIVALAGQPLFIAARASLEAEDLKELIALAKAKRGQITYGTPGIGTESHLIMERLARNAGIEFVHVPYRGGAAAVTDLMGDRLDLVPLTEIALRSALESGKAKLLVTFDPTRVSHLPNVASIAEMGFPNDVFVARLAIFGPAKLPPDVVSRWISFANTLKDDPAFLKGMKDTGSELSVLDPGALRPMMAAERRSFQALIEQIGIRGE